MNNTIPTQMPWWRSKVIVSAVVSMILKVLVLAGVSGELAAADQSQLIDVIMLLVSGVADLVAIASRVRQKYAPAITANKTSFNRSFTALAAIGLLPIMMIMSMSACAFNPLPVPSDVANKTVLDEKAGFMATTAYNAGNLAAQLAIQSGIVKDPVTIAKIGALDNRAFAAIEAIRAAYESGNADSYDASIAKARLAIDEMTAAIKGDTP